MRKYHLYIAWVLASIGFLVSLYFSEIKFIEPCALCWYQRICLFPLAFLLGIATFKDDVRVSPYLLLLSFAGLLFAGYQVMIQEFPFFSDIEVCGRGPSCSQKIYLGIGSITLPMASFVNFFLISILLCISWIYKIKET